MAETEQESESYRQSTFFSIWLTDEWSQGISLKVESIKCPLLLSVLSFFCSGIIMAASLDLSHKKAQ